VDATEGRLIDLLDTGFASYVAAPHASI